MKRSGYGFPIGSMVLVTALLLMGFSLSAWADRGAPLPDDPLRPMNATRDILIYVQMRPAVGPPIPTISIAPAGTNPQAKLKVESSIPSVVDFYFFYRGTHPYFYTAPHLSTFAGEFSDTIRTLDVSDPSHNFFVDVNGGIGRASVVSSPSSDSNFCYFARAVDAVDPAAPETWLFSGPSNVVCDWDYKVLAPSGSTHWNQVAIPVYSSATDSLAGWGNRLAPNINYINKWGASTQAFTTQATYAGGHWTTGRRPTQYVRPYFISVNSNGDLSLWGDKLADVQDTLINNNASGLTSLNNVCLQPAWHWVQDDSSSSWRTLGQHCYTSDPGFDNGVREIKQWGASTQAWSSRVHWTSTTSPYWTNTGADLRVYTPIMLNRANTNTGGTPSDHFPWPPLMR